MSLKVLFVTEGYPPDVGGVATSSQRVARNLHKAGCEVVVCSFDYSRPSSEPDYTVTSDDAGVRLHRSGPYFEVPALVSDDLLSIHRRRVYDQFARVAQDFAPDLILSFFAGTAGLLATYLANSQRVPHVVSLRGKDIGMNIFSASWLAVLQQIVAGSAKIVCVNDHLKARLAIAFPAALARATVIMNGTELPDDVIGTASRSYVVERAGWARNDVVAVFVGEPREKKGFHLLLRAIDRIRHDVPIRLLVVGPGFKKAEQAQQGELWNRLTAEKALHCTGHLPRADALRTAAEGDLIVMPSIEDGLANGLLEGMALGLCPVVSDLFDDIVVSGESGYVTRRNDLDSLAAGLVAAAQPAAPRALFGAAARARIAATFTAQREAEAYLRVFAEVLRPAPGPMTPSL